MLYSDNYKGLSLYISIKLVQGMKINVCLMFSKISKKYKIQMISLKNKSAAEGARFFLKEYF